MRAATIRGFFLSFATPGCPFPRAGGYHPRFPLLLRHSRMSFPPYGRLPSALSSFPSPHRIFPQIHMEQRQKVCDRKYAMVNMQQYAAKKRDRRWGRELFSDPTSVPSTVTSFRLLLHFDCHFIFSVSEFLPPPVGCTGIQESIQDHVDECDRRSHCQHVILHRDTHFFKNDHVQ